MLNTKNLKEGDVVGVHKANLASPTNIYEAKVVRVLKAGVVVELKGNAGIVSMRFTEGGVEYGSSQNSRPHFLFEASELEERLRTYRTEARSWNLRIKRAALIKELQGANMRHDEADYQRIFEELGANS